MKIRDIFFIIFLFLCGSLYADAKQNTKNVSLQLKWNYNAPKNPNNFSTIHL
jgi:hypothetical protein